MTRLSCSQPSVFASAPGNKVLYKQASKYSPNEQTPLLLHRACQQGFILPGLEFTRKTDGGIPHSVPRTMARVHMMMSMVIRSCPVVTAPQGLKPQVTVTSANESSVLASLTNHSPGCHHNQSYAPRGQTSQLLIAITNICELVSQSTNWLPGPRCQAHHGPVCPCLFRLSEQSCSREERAWCHKVMPMSL